jgi:hypothetical protein
VWWFLRPIFFGADFAVSLGVLGKVGGRDGGFVVS